MVDDRVFTKIYIASLVEWAREQARLRRPPAYLPPVLITLMVAILAIDIGLAAEAFNSLYSDEYAEKTVMDWVLTFAKALLPVAPAVILKVAAEQFGIFSADRITWSNRDRTWIRRAKFVWGIGIAICGAFAIFFLYQFGQTAFGEVSATARASLADQQPLDLFATGNNEATLAVDDATSYSWLALSLPLSAVSLALCYFRLSLYHVEEQLFRHYQDIADQGDQRHAIALNIAQLEAEIIPDEKLEAALAEEALTGERQVVRSFIEGLEFPINQVFQNGHLVIKAEPVQVNGVVIADKVFAFRDIDEARALLSTCFDAIEGYDLNSQTDAFNRLRALTQKPNPPKEASS